MVGVAKSAVNAGQQAQAAAQARASTRDQQRDALSHIPLPTKSLYVDVHDPSAWANPFLAVGPDAITLRIVQADANTSDVGKGTMLRPDAARRQEIEIRPKDLAEAMVAVPPGRVAVWPRGGSGGAAGGYSKRSPKDPAQCRNCDSAAERSGDRGRRVANALGHPFFDFQPQASKAAFSPDGNSLRFNESYL